MQLPHEGGVVALEVKALLVISQQIHEVELIHQLRRRCGVRDGQHAGEFIVFDRLPGLWPGEAAAGEVATMRREQGEEVLRLDFLEDAGARKLGCFDLGHSGSQPTPARD